MTILAMTTFTSYCPPKAHLGHCCRAITALLCCLACFCSAPGALASRAPSEKTADAAATDDMAPKTQAKTSGEATGQNHNATLDKLAAMDLDNLDFADEGFDWRHDWWKYLVLVFASLLALFLFLLLARMLFSLVVSLACILISLLGSMILTPLLTSRLDDMMSGPFFGVVTTRHLALGLSFVACYLVTSLLIRIIYHPTPSGKKK